MRHLVVLALRLWLPDVDPIEPLDSWDDEQLAQFITVRFAWCPRCGVLPGRRCIGLGALAGQHLRLHHVPRTDTAARWLVANLRRIPARIPFVVAVDGTPVAARAIPHRV